MLYLLILLGSHDSFSFYIDEASPVGPEQPETVQNFVSVFGTVAKKLMRKWLATQTMNFTGQLGAGIRYFDLRISTKPRDPDNELYFAHGLFSAKVNEGLEEINAFLTDHHKEVVFLDFNHFYGMQKYHHEKLVQMLKDIYGNKMCPAIFAQEVSLKYLWEKDYQVLVFYHSPVALEVPFLWPGQMMPAPWANTTDPEKLGVSSTLYGKQLRNIQSLLFSNDPFYYIGDLILCVNILLFDFHVVSLLMASVFHYKSRYSLLQVKFQNLVRSPCS